LLHQFNVSEKSIIEELEEFREKFLSSNNFFNKLNVMLFWTGVSLSETTIIDSRTLGIFFHEWVTPFSSQELSI
jgi:hypothetical protein